MSRTPALTRRDFLTTSTRTAAALGVGSMLASRTAAAERRKIGANDRITIGIIGSGGMGTYDVRATCNVDNVVCAALCDLAEFRLDRASAAATEVMESKGHTGIRIDRYGDYRKLLDRKDIDAVIIATPDHWHRRPFIAACEAGKHIYQEKPFSFSIQDGDDMLAAAKKRPELTIQIGTQRRSGSHYSKAKAIIDEGKLGRIMYARAYDCRNFVSNPDPFAPQQVSGPIDWDTFQEPCKNKVSYDPWRYFAWRWYWDYANGLLTDVGVHVLDVVHWLTGCDTPRSAVCNGGVYGLKYWETPDVVDAVWDYGTHSVAFTSNFTNGFQGNGLTLYGTEATLEIRGAHIYVWAEGQRDKPLYEWAPEGIAHQHNWIDCIRSGEQPNAPVELGVSSLLPLHLATLAYRKGTRVTWDAEARKIV
jgi:predicted dehydrogenase